MENDKGSLPKFEAPSDTRRRTMASVKSANTKPELYVRRKLHAAGFRFRLYRKDLPGRPDIVLPRYRIAVLVQGCFWHGHSCPRGSRVPKTNTSYWKEKISRNVERDQRVYDALSAVGWQPVVIWECTIKEETDSLVKLLVTLRDGIVATK